MGYFVRLLSPSEKIISFREIQDQVESVKLAAGTDHDWKRIEVFNPPDNLIAILEKVPAPDTDTLENELAKLKESIRDSYPISARDWIKRYLARVKTVYIFQLFGDRINKDGWPTLGRIQNYLEDSLSGIIQADNEGFYNENGDYILWQMYAGATGAIPAATLDENGDWTAYQLKLNERSIEQFKQGIVPRKSFLSRLLGG